MGRNRRTHTDHAIRTPREGSVSTSYVWGATWCGDSNGMSAQLSRAAEGEDPLAYSRRSSNCPKCAAAIGKARLKQIADRVRLEAATAEEITGKYGRNYRGLYRLFIDDVHRGWIVMQNGWGNPWELHQLSTDTEYRPFGTCISHKPGDYSTTKPTDTFQMVHFHSKDMMASAALRAFEENSNNLPTIPEMLAAREVERARRQEETRQREADKLVWAAERERKDGLRAERKATALAGLEQLSALPELSNLERAGLQAALDIINGKDVA